LTEALFSSCSCIQNVEHGILKILDVFSPNFQHWCILGQGFGFRRSHWCQWCQTWASCWDRWRRTRQH